jgi:hypothetical protein
MSSAWDNLKANAQQNSLLSDAGMFKPTQSYINWLEGLKYANPNVTPIQLGLDAVSRSGGDSDFRGAAAGVDHTDPKQDFRDYWNLDNDWAGTRDIAQGVNWLAGGGMLGNAAIMGADYAYGRNPAEDVGSLIGSQLATPYARSMEEAMALGKAGSSLGSLTANSLVGNNVFGEYLSPYTQGIKDSPWHDELTAMGLEQGTDSYDHALTAMMGGDLRSVDPDMMQAYDDRGQKNWRTSESTLEDYKAGSITAIEPTSVNDFAGMFSGNSPIMGYGQQGDDTWQDSSGTTLHSDSYNWNNDGGWGDTNTSEGTTAGDYQEAGFTQEDADFATSFD